MRILNDFIGIVKNRRPVFQKRSRFFSTSGGPLERACTACRNLL